MKLLVYFFISIFLTTSTEVDFFNIKLEKINRKYKYDKNIKNIEFNSYYDSR